MSLSKILSFSCLNVLKMLKYEYIFIYFSNMSSTVIKVFQYFLIIFKSKSYYTSSILKFIYMDFNMFFLPSYIIKTNMASGKRLEGSRINSALYLKQI